jgi:hypothetical protein
MGHIVYPEEIMSARIKELEAELRLAVKLLKRWGDANPFGSGADELIAFIERNSK